MDYYDNRKRLLRTSYTKININCFINISQVLEPQLASAFVEYFRSAEIKYEISLRTLPSPYPHGTRIHGLYGTAFKINRLTKRRERIGYKIQYFRPIYIITLEQSKYRISKKVLRIFITLLDSLFDGNILLILYWKSRMRFAFIKDKFILTKWRKEEYLNSFDEYDMRLCDHNNFWKKIVCKAYGIDPLLLNKKSNVDILFDGLQDEEKLNTAIKIVKDSAFAYGNDRSIFMHYDYAYDWVSTKIGLKNVRSDDDMDD